MLPKVPVPNSVEKSAGLYDVLFGLGPKLNLAKNKALKGYVTKHVTPSGYLKSQYTKPGVLTDVRKILGLFVGQKGALGGIKSRYLQGGLLGKGGVLRGELAFNPETLAATKRLRMGKGIAGDRKRMVGGMALGGLNTAVMAGLPAYFIHEVATAPGRTTSEKVTNALREAGSGAGWLAAGPLGLLGGSAVSTALSGGGGFIGKALRGGVAQQEKDTALAAAAYPRYVAPTHLDYALMPAVTPLNIRHGAPEKVLSSAHSGDNLLPNYELALHNSLAT
tara:strand:- start:615 stop:1448 length:834 start_codon:yes stop_codon:yes gene_type:complete